MRLCIQLKIIVCLSVLCLSAQSVKAEDTSFNNPLEAVASIFSAPSTAPALTPVALTEAIEGGAIDQSNIQNKDVLKAFYSARAYEPLWLGKGAQRQAKAKMLVSVLENAWRHGLNPTAYNVDQIKAALEQANTDENIYQLELLLSDMAVQYAQDLTAMRVDPRSIGQRARYWREPISGEEVLSQISISANVKQAFKAIEPKGQLYKRLQEELSLLYQTKGPDQDEQPISVSGIIRPGNSHRAVLRIRERMGLDPDLAPQGAYVYDDQLAQAVMAFQKGQGVAADGIIGPQTIKLMNITREDRINQIIVNLERLRWLEEEKPERYVMVNVPSATLWAIENNQVVLEMPVVVGRQKRPTNIFNTKITGIRFNPKWTVPPTIKKEDYLPKLREDPYYLTDRGIELVDSENMTVDPGLIDWEEKTWAEVNMMRMVQGSGERNPLGLVRVIMQNPYNIYLHDTPQKSYFRRSNRALSSGCVRMEKPFEFADFVLKNNEGWSEEKRQGYIARGREVNIQAAEPLPVYLVYQTVWLGENGQIVYGQDIYDHDRVLLRELRKINGIVDKTEENVQLIAENDHIT